MKTETFKLNIDNKTLEVELIILPKEPIVLFLLEWETLSLWQLL